VTLSSGEGVAVKHGCESERCSAAKEAETHVEMMPPRLR
jgi:hypothetical protein